MAIGTMRAMAHGPDGALRLEERPIPAPGRGQILLKVTAAGVNRPDLLQRSGLYPPPPGASDLMGLEASGEVAALGEGVERWRIGDQVCALLNGGGYADFALVAEGAALPIPKTLDPIEAAALPEAAFTVWANVFEAGRLSPGETLLVHGGASGIGTTAIQMAAAYGARVLATAGDPEKCALCVRLGAARAIDYRKEDFEAIVRAEGGADVVLDMVGGAYVPKNLAILNEDGRLVQIAFLQGARVDLDLMRLMLKRLTLTGSTLRARSDQEKARLARAVERAVWPWVEARRVRPVIDSTYPLAEVEAAHARMTSGSHAGKIVLIAGGL